MDGKYVCDEPNCGLEFKTAGALGSHKRYVHNKKAPYTQFLENKDSKQTKVDSVFYCPVCGSVMEIDFIGAGKGRYQPFVNCPNCRR